MAHHGVPREAFSLVVAAVVDAASLPEEAASTREDPPARAVERRIPAPTFTRGDTGLPDGLLR